MGQIHLRQRIEHPASAAWEWLKDFGNIHRIHPMIGRSYLDGSATCGVGATRVCEMKMGGYYLRERVVDWKEGQSYTVDIYDTSMPMMGRSLATFGVRPLGVDSSEVYMDIDYSMKGGAFGRAIDALFMNSVMTRMMQGMFGKLDRALRDAKGD